MSNQDGSTRKPVRASVVAGITLIIAGILFFLIQVVGLVFNIDLSALTWPFFIIVPGLVIFVVALFLPADAGLGFGMFGGMVTATGLILLYQNLTNHWESWAYAWALIAPTSTGASQWIFGILRKRADWARIGSNQMVIGLVIFVVGAAFFELVLNISGRRFPWGGIVWPLLLVLLGLILLLRSLISAVRKD